MIDTSSLRVYEYILCIQISWDSKQSPPTPAHFISLLLVTFILAEHVTAAANKSTEGNWQQTALVNFDFKVNII